MIYSYLFFIFIFGLIIGSFLNCLIWRLHKEESLWGRSYCLKCKKQIAWYDNIPILSFILLRGRCRHCQRSISWQYPIVELLTGVLFVITVISNLGLVIWGSEIADFIYLDLITNYKLHITILRDWFIIAIMIIIFVYDLRWYLILDRVILPASVIVFILNLILGMSWLNLVISAIIGGGFFLVQFIISKGRWIGGGDIRLGIFMGLSLGRIDYLILAIFLAYFIGSIVGVGLILTGKKKWGSQVPLGVFLSAATIITIFWGEGIISWYLGLF